MSNPHHGTVTSLSQNSDLLLIYEHFLSHIGEHFRCDLEGILLYLFHGFIFHFFLDMNH